MLAMMGGSPDAAGHDHGAHAGHAGHAGHVS